MVGSEHPDMRSRVSSALGAETATDRPGRVVLTSFEIEGPDRSGGIATAVTALAERLLMDGHDVHLLYVPYIDDADMAAWVEHWRGRDITVHHRSRHTDRGWLNFPRTSAVVADAIDQLRPDVAHFMDCDALGAAYVARRALGRTRHRAAVVTTTHGSMAWDRAANAEPMDPMAEAVDVGLRHLLTHSDVVCHPSRFMHEWVVGHYGARPNVDLVIPNALPSTTPAPRDRNSARVPVDEVVLFGRLVPRKGLARFAAAVESLRRDEACPPFRVTLMGREHAEHPVSELRSMFTHAGPCDGPPVRWITDFDRAEALGYLRDGNRLAVVPSTHDNLPYTVYEALHLGVPLLASSVGGIPELVDDTTADRILLADSAESLAAAIRSALVDGATVGGLAFDPIDAGDALATLHQLLIDRSRTGIDQPDLSAAATTELRSFVREGRPVRPMARRAKRLVRSVLRQSPRRTSGRSS